MKMCIFNSGIQCTNCGECNLCEYNKSKTCDNCGKCLQLEGFDVKAIKIDEVFEPGYKENTSSKIDIEAFSDFDYNSESDEEVEEAIGDEEVLYEDNITDEDYVDALGDDENWEYIDDIEGFTELLEEGLDSTGELVEKYPGLFVINKK